MPKSNAMPIEVEVVVKPTTKRLSEPDDRSVAGVYLMLVDGDTPKEDHASAALDAFHDKHAIACLDDFDVYARMPGTTKRLVESEAHESYSLKGNAKSMGIR